MVRWRVAVFGPLAALAATPVATIPAAAVVAVTSPSANTISLTGTAPNYYYDGVVARGQDKQGAPRGYDAAVVAVADQTNQLLFEMNLYSDCRSSGEPSIVRLDIDTFARKALGPCNLLLLQAGASNMDLLAIDPKDRLLFIAENAAPSQDLVVLSEDTLQVVARWTPPQHALPPAQNAFPYVAGLSWHEATDQLVVMTTQGGGVAGVALSAFDVRAALANGGTASWTSLVTDCTNPMSAGYVGANPYITSDAEAVIVPCELAGLGGSVSAAGQREGIVKLELTPTGPTHRATVAEAPGRVSDLFFDPQFDRGFMPFNQTASYAHGSTVFVYDARTGQFGGSTALGSAEDQASFSLNLDAQTGRFYAVGWRSGMTVVDGRRTPLSPGIVFRDYHAHVSAIPSPVLPPDTVYPYRRVLVQNPGSDDLSKETYPNFTVYADTLPVTSDPPSSVIDRGHTLQGPPPAGSTVSTVFGGTARGYGAHVDVVGGAAGVAADLGSPNFSIPLGNGSKEFLGGVIEQLTLHDTSAQGAASALAIDTSTSYGVAQCTDAQTFGSCAPPPQCPSGLQPLCSYPSLPANTYTSQTWSFPDAACTLPGTKTEDTSGIRYTAPYNEQPTPSDVPQNDAANAAQAHVQCKDSKGRASAEAHVSAIHIGTSGQSVSIGEATSQSQVTPPANGAGVVATTTSHAQVHVDLGLGKTLDIDATQVGTAIANGRPGTASATDTVSFANAYATDNGQVRNLCEGASKDHCRDPQTVVDAINRLFGAEMQVILPQPDSRYFPNGSPGGYTAAVQANLTEQYADQQFNGMTAEVATYLPALRLIMYGYADGNPAISRTIIDLAGVEDDAALGLQAFPPPEICTDCSGGGNGGGTAGTPATTTNVGGGDGSGGTQGNATKPGNPKGPGGIVGLADAVYNGLNWLIRSPLQAAKMLLFLAVMGLPIVLTRRRWTWFDDAGGQSE
jgi:hypothetical protein